MQLEEKIKMFNDVFAPKKGEKVLILADIPHDDIKDNKNWIDRRKMAKDWFDTFTKMGKETNFSVEYHEYKATGMDNSPVPQDALDKAIKSNLIIAMTEYSGSSSFLVLCKKNASKIRGASMPGVEKRMEKTAFQANYSDVKKYAIALKKMLNDSIGAEVKFSTGDNL